jgi:hypothetical protein
MVQLYLHVQVDFSRLAHYKFNLALEIGVHMNVEISDRQDLIKLLVSMPVLSQFQGREAVMVTAGLQTLLPQLHLEGPAFVALSNLVNDLEAFGRTANGYEALGQFLNTIKEMGLVGLEGQRFLDDLLRKYSLMIPVIGSQPIDKWHGSDEPEKTYEKIIGDNTLRPIAFLQQAIEAAKSVCFINVGGKRAGTGFMISRDLLLTCQHVLPSATDAQETLFRFNYQVGLNGEMVTMLDYRMVHDGIFLANKDLDYAIVELNGSPGKDWGYLDLTNSSPEVGGRVNIIQHPAAQPKQISIQNNFIEYVGGSMVAQVVKTEKSTKLRATFLLFRSYSFCLCPTVPV